MIEELLKGEVVLFIEKKDGTIVVAGSQLGAQVIQQMTIQVERLRFKRIYSYFSDYGA
jgi:hypothetical protein